MQDMFNYPDVTGSVATARAAPKDPIIITGSAAAAAPKPNPPAAQPAKADAPAAGPAQPSPSDPKAAIGTPVPLDAPRAFSTAERAILERLHERRQELDARARELDLRESLLKAAEQKLETKQAEQKDTESRGGGQRRDEVE